MCRLYYCGPHLFIVTSYNFLHSFITLQLSLATLYNSSQLFYPVPGDPFESSVSYSTDNF